jgi:hypothetical protein
VLREKIVGPAREPGRAFPVGDALNAWRVERQEHHLHAVSVHLGKTTLLHVQQPALEFWPVIIRHKASRVHQRFVCSEMLFESDFALHRSILSHK